MKLKEESKKADLKLSIQKTNIMASGPITSWQIKEGTCGQNTFLEALKSKAREDTEATLLSTQTWEVRAEPQTTLRGHLERTFPRHHLPSKGVKLALTAVPILVHELVQTLIFESRLEP